MSYSDWSSQDKTPTRLQNEQILKAGIKSMRLVGVTGEQVSSQNIDGGVCFCFHSKLHSQFGEVSPEEALEKSKSLKMDLILVSSQPAVGKMADPKVSCVLKSWTGNPNNFMLFVQAAKVAHEKQKANEKKARQQRPTVKEMRISESIGDSPVPPSLFSFEHVPCCQATTTCR